MYKSSMYNRSRGEGLAVGAELRHERCLFFGSGEGRLERIAREEDALVRGEAAFSRGRVVARIDVAAYVEQPVCDVSVKFWISARAVAVRRPVRRSTAAIRHTAVIERVVTWY